MSLSRLSAPLVGERDSISCQNFKSTRERERIFRGRGIQIEDLLITQRPSLVERKRTGKLIADRKGIGKGAPSPESWKRKRRANQRRIRRVDHLYYRIDASINTQSQRYGITSLAQRPYLGGELVSFSRIRRFQKCSIIRSREIP